MCCWQISANWVNLIHDAMVNGVAFEDLIDDASGRLEVVAPWPLQQVGHEKCKWLERLVCPGIHPVKCAGCWIVAKSYEQVQKSLSVFHSTGEDLIVSF